MQFVSLQLHVFQFYICSIDQHLKAGFYSVTHQPLQWMATLTPAPKFMPGKIKPLGGA